MPPVSSPDEKEALGQSKIRHLSSDRFGLMLWSRLLEASSLENYHYDSWIDRHQSCGFEYVVSRWNGFSKSHPLLGSSGWYKCRASSLEHPWKWITAFFCNWVSTHARNLGVSDETLRRIIVRCPTAWLTAWVHQWTHRWLSAIVATFEGLHFARILLITLTLLMFPIMHFWSSRQPVSSLIANASIA